MAYKYPYIPKEYYAAVMFACKMVRQSGYKNKAIKTAARYYSVDEDELRRHFEARAAAGAKGKGNTGKKFKYFVVATYFGCDAQGFDEAPAKVEIVKGISKKTVKNRFSEADLNYDRRNDTGSSYSLYRHHTIMAECETKEEAEKFITTLKEENKNV